MVGWQTVWDILSLSVLWRILSLSTSKQSILDHKYDHSTSFWMTECHFLVVNYFLEFKCYPIHNQIFVQPEHCSHNCSHWDIYLLCIIIIALSIHIYQKKHLLRSGLPATCYLCVAPLLSVCVGGVLIAPCISGGYKGISHCETEINQLINYKKKTGSATSAAFEAHPSWQVWRPVSVQIWLSALHATLILMKVFWITLHSH